MARQRIVSREYKVMVDHRLFADRKPAAEVVVCSRNGTKFVAKGSSPLEAYRQAIRFSSRWEKWRD